VPRTPSGRFASVEAATVVPVSSSLFQEAKEARHMHIPTTFTPTADDILADGVVLFVDAFGQLVFLIRTAK
jgi:hypothetical protein